MRRNYFAVLLLPLGCEGLGWPEVALPLRASAALGLELTLPLVPLPGVEADCSPAASPARGGVGWPLAAFPLRASAALGLPATEPPEVLEAAPLLAEGSAQAAVVRAATAAMVKNVFVFIVLLI